MGGRGWGRVVFKGFVVGVMILSTLRVRSTTALRQAEFFSSSAGACGKLPSSQLATPTTITGKKVQNIAVLGDGDLTFCRALAARCSGMQISIVGTTLESRFKLTSQYAKAEAAINDIENLGQRTAHGVDATSPSSLREAFGSSLYERLIWNFPHVPGKQNIGRNRLLLRDFFRSSLAILHPAGEICINLAQGQGGTHVDIYSKWNETWQVTVQAAEEDFKLVDVRVSDLSGFERLGYGRTGHRGKDRSFHIGAPILHTFVLNSAESAHLGAICPPSWRHELHLRSEKYVDTESVEKAVRFVAGTDNIHNVKPSHSHVCQDGVESFAWEIVYGSHISPFGRGKADSLRAEIEEKVPTLLNCELRGGKRGMGRVEKTAIALWELDD
jgi:hypothetical protein